MPWKIIKEFRFEAAHFLPHHTGKCQRLHGHSWRGKVVVESHLLKKAGASIGMVMDFADVKAIIQQTIDEQLDHYCLNETLNLDNPTSEEVARYLFLKWVHAFEHKGVKLAAVHIHETCTSECIYVFGD